MADNSYRQSVEQAKQDILEIVSYIKLMDDMILELANKVKNELGGAFKAVTPTDLTQTLKEQALVIEKLSMEVENLKKRQEELTLKKQALNTMTGQEIANNRILARNNNLQTQATSKLGGAYAQLVARQKMAKKVLQDLIAISPLQTEKVRAAKVEYERLSQKIDAANKATNLLSRGGIGGLIRGFQKLLGAFGIVGGVFAFAKFTKELVKTTTKLQSLDFALRRIVSSNEEFARTNKFLEDITESYGAEIITTTERYTKFLAAAKQSNISMEDTEKVFRTVTKASGVLGLKTDELTGIYLALEQMLSKGKVTTEELRRQLGERLPGAFGIMATALGVSTRQLDKMLKSGEVLSSEALPKFADELEKAYGIRSVKKIDTIVAAQARMKNAWVSMVRAITSATGLDTLLIKVFNGISNLGNAIAGADKKSQSFSKTIDQERIALNTLMIEIMKTNEGTEERATLMDKLLEKYPFMIKFVDAENDSNTKLKATLEDVNEMYLKRLALERLREKLQVEDKQAQVADSMAALASMTEKYNQALEEINIKRFNNDLDNMSGSVEQNAETLRLLLVRRIQNNEYLQQQGKITDAQTIQLKNDRKALDFLIDATKTYTSVSTKSDFFTIMLRQAENEIKDMTKLLGVSKEQLDDYFGFDQKPIEIVYKKPDTSELKKAQDEARKEAYEAEKARLETNMYFNEQIMKDETRSLSDKLLANEMYYLNSKELIKLQAEYEKEVGEQRVNVVKKVNQEKLKADAEANQKYKESQQKLREEEFKKRMEQFKLLEQQNENSLDSQIVDMTFAMLAEGKSLNKIEKEVSKFRDKERKKQLEQEIDYAIKEVETWAVTTEQKATFVQALIKLKQELAGITDAPDVEKWEAMQRIFQGLTETFGEFFDFDTSKFDFIFDTLKEGEKKLFDKENIDNWVSLAKEGIGAVLDASLKRYEVELQEAQRVRDLILNNELSTEREKEAARRKFEREERRIKTEMARKERENALVKVAVDTAGAIVSTLLQVPKFDFGISAFAIASIIAGIGAAQAAFIASQPLPKFEKGTMNAPQGWAIVDEARPEVHLDKFMNIKSFGSEKGANIRYLEKGDKIIPTRSKFFNQTNIEDLNKAIFNMNMESNGNDLSSIDFDMALIREVSMLRNDFDKLGNKFEKISKRPIVVNNKVKIEHDSAY